MFSKLEIALMHEGIQNTLKQINEDRFVKGVDGNKRLELDQKLTQYVTLSHKLVSAVPNGTIKEVALANTSPVLVVDDSLIDREINVTALKELGFDNVLEAKEGQEALAIMSEQHKSGIPVGLVMCDWNMPNMSGIEFTKTVRRDRNLWNTPIYFVTANHDKAHIITALKAGISGYIVKPVAFKALQTKFAAYAPKREAAAEVKAEESTPETQNQNTSTTKE